MNKWQKKIIICILSALSLVSPINASAKVYSEATGNGPGDAIYVAGNPDMYPIEYYDAKSKSYKGVIPDILKMISEDTGLDFVYIYAGQHNRQRELSSNRQVEIVTAVSSAEEYNLTQSSSIISYETDGHKQTYSIGFTDNLDKEKAALIKTALGNITDEEKMGILISNAEQPHTLHKEILFVVILVVCIVLTIGGIVVVNHRKRKKEGSQEDYTDKLTGIGNSDYYMYVFDHLISTQSKNLYSVAYLAFDREKTEKQYGVNAITDIEKYTATKLSSYMGSVEYAARIQTGTFVFLFQSENTEKCIERVKQALDGINKYLGEFNDGWGNLFKAGICRLCEHKGVNSETAFYNARQGYLHAVSKGMDCYIGSQKQIAQNRKTDKLRSLLSDALRKGDFKIFIQPMIASHTGTFCGGEVLSRWQNREYGLLYPYEYMEILKETEKIIEHDYNVFEQTCALLEKWSELPYKDMFLTCNFTRLSVEKNDFAKNLEEIAKKYNFQRQRLVIEITEDSLNAEVGNLSENIIKCKKMGFRIAIDDMGTGFSSFADIYDNEIDIVKIERNFVSSCNTERRKKMLGDIITLVHNAGAKIICEGVETEQQSDMLKKLNCDIMQGYYYSRALPLSECERILKSRQ